MGAGSQPGAHGLRPAALGLHRAPAAAGPGLARAGGCWNPQIQPRPPTLRLSQPRPFQGPQQAEHLGSYLLSSLGWSLHTCGHSKPTGAATGHRCPNEPFARQPLSSGQTRHLGGYASTPGSGSTHLAHHEDWACPAQLTQSYPPAPATGLPALFWANSRDGTCPWPWPPVGLCPSS